MLDVVKQNERPLEHAASQHKATRGNVFVAACCIFFAQAWGGMALATGRGVRSAVRSPQNSGIHVLVHGCVWRYGCAFAMIGLLIIVL